MCILENFMEDELYYQQLKNEYEYRMWELFIQQEEEKQRAEELAAAEHFKALEQYETSIMEKDYRSLLEWDLTNN